MENVNTTYRQFIGTKLVQATPMSANLAVEKGYEVTVAEDGFEVIIPNVKTVWMSKESFEKIYKPIDGLTFGLAIEAMKKGKKVSRAGWNGKGMHIFLEEHFTALINMGGRKLERKYEPVICMWTAQQTTQPGWLASQADILANDWCIVD